MNIADQVGRGAARSVNNRRLRGHDTGSSLADAIDDLRHCMNVAAL